MLSFGLPPVRGTGRHFKSNQAAILRRNQRARRSPTSKKQSQQHPFDVAVGGLANKQLLGRTSVFSWLQEKGLRRASIATFSGTDERRSGRQTAAGWESLPQSAATM